MASYKETKRLHRELQELAEERKKLGRDAVEVDAELVDEGNMMAWRGRIRGPEGTPYEGGIFVLNISLPSDYPYSPPKIHFDTKVWHPNISSQTGAICLDTLKDAWTPALTLRTVLLSIQALLSAPQPDDPQDAQVAKMYRADYNSFVDTAKQWTIRYAASEKTKLEKLLEYGFDRASSEKALRENNWDVESAVSALLGGN